MGVFLNSTSRTFSADTVLAIFLQNSRNVASSDRWFAYLSGGLPQQILTI